MRTPRKIPYRYRKRLRWIQRLCEIRAGANLQTLPTELFLHICHFLPDNEIISLSLTCRKFYRDSPVTIEDLFARPCHSSKGQPRFDERQAYQDMLRQQPSRHRGSLSSKIKPNQEQFCASCLSTHKTSEFSATALREPSDRRRCLMEEGLLWLCPSMIWALVQTIALSREYELQPSTPCSKINHGLCACKQHFSTYYNGRIIQAFPISTFDDQKCITNEEWLTHSGPSTCVSVPT